MKKYLLFDRDTRLAVITYVTAFDFQYEFGVMVLYPDRFMDHDEFQHWCNYDCLHVRLK